jgi:hypothetical protein
MANPRREKIKRYFSIEKTPIYLVYFYRVGFAAQEYNEESREISY